MASNKGYIHALHYQWLNGLYDPVVRLTTRETTVKQAIIELLPVLTSGELLDVASGSGTLTRATRIARPGCGVRGIDGDRDMLARAQEKASLHGLDIHYDHGLAQELPYADHTFDVVMSSLFFHHLTTAGKGAALREIRRVLKSEGLLIIADWGYPQNVLMRALFVLVQLLDGFETTADNVRGRLPELIRDAGFSRVDSIRNLATPLGTISLLRASI